MNYFGFISSLLSKPYTRISMFLRLCIIIIGFIAIPLPVQAQGIEGLAESLKAEGDRRAQFLDIDSAVVFYTWASNMGYTYALNALKELDNKYKKSKKHRVTIPARLEYAWPGHIKEITEETPCVSLVEIVTDTSMNNAVDSALSMALHEPIPIVGTGSELVAYQVFSFGPGLGEEDLVVAVRVVVKLPKREQPQASFKIDTKLQEDLYAIKKANSEKAITKYFEFMSEYLPKNIVWDLNLHKTANPPVKGELTFHFTGDSYFINEFFDVMKHANLSALLSVKDEVRGSPAGGEAERARDSFYRMIAAHSQELVSKTMVSKTKTEVILPRAPFLRNYGSIYEYAETPQEVLTYRQRMNKTLGYGPLQEPANVFPMNKKQEAELKADERFFDYYPLDDNNHYGVFYPLPLNLFCIVTDQSAKWLDENKQIIELTRKNIFYLFENGLPDFFHTYRKVEIKIPINIELSQEEFDKTNTIILKPYRELNFGQQLSVLESMRNNFDDRIFSLLYNITKSQTQLYPERLQALEQTKESILGSEKNKRLAYQSLSQAKNILMELNMLKSRLMIMRNAKLSDLISICNEAIQLCNQGILASEEAIEYFERLEYQKEINSCKDIINDINDSKDMWSHNLRALKK